MTWFFLTAFMLYESITGRPFVSWWVRRKWQPKNPHVVRGSNRPTND